MSICGKHIRLLDLASEWLPPNDEFKLPSRARIDGRQLLAVFDGMPAKLPDLMHRVAK
jgi:hypothetical protein